MQEIKFKFGGVDRKVAPRIGLAMAIEAATDTGVISLGISAGNGTVKLSQIVLALQCILDASGAKYSFDDIVKIIDEHENPSSAASIVARVINGLFEKPESKRSAKQSGNGRLPLATADSH